MTGILWYVLLGGILGLSFIFIIVGILGNGLDAIERNKDAIERLEECIKGSEVVEPEEIICILRGEKNGRN